MTKLKARSHTCRSLAQQEGALIAAALPTELYAEPESVRLQRLHTWTVAPQSFLANVDWVEDAGLLAAASQLDCLFERC